MKRSLLLTLEGVINLTLGALLLLFPAELVSELGIPATRDTFYPTILGGVLFGIGIALFAELRSKGLGLGLIGAVIINICGGLVLACWLLFGGLTIPGRGYVLLWLLVVILVGISLFELFNVVRDRKTARA